MQTEETALDAEELLHLAIRATEQDNDAQAIEYLKRALVLDPDNAKLHYMLGALHAQIGLYERAIENMRSAVERDPSLETAHFQLGLLHISSGNVAQAEKAWEPLDALGGEHPLYLFKAGMLHLARNEFGQCIENVERGIERNTRNEALNNDMRGILGEARKALQSQPAATHSDDAEAQPPAGNRHAFLSIYKDSESDSEH